MNDLLSPKTLQVGAVPRSSLPKAPPTRLGRYQSGEGTLNLAGVLSGRAVLAGLFQDSMSLALS